jgi:restriction system-associated AAA family ATPase
MKLLRVHVVSANTCGGLLDGLDLWFRSPYTPEYSDFDPLCLIGPNGAGKSQFLQVLTEIFQSVYHTCIPNEERIESNSELQFEVEYLIRPTLKKDPIHVKISRASIDRHRPKLVIQKKEDGEWVNCDPESPLTHDLLPKKVIGYTSGENETLSLPFLVSRSGYADEVGRTALSDETENRVLNTRLMLIDYGTNLEVVVSNLLTNDGKELKALLQDARLKDLHSFRCVVQLAHSAAPKLPKSKKSNSKRKGIQLTPELEDYLTKLQRCSTCYSYDQKDEKYIFDFWINEESKKAFRFFWESTLDLYTSLHKLSMLNDLAIPKVTRDRFRRDTKNRRFASRLPEPQDEDKVFRFDQVRFYSQSNNKVVDYVSLSDGEHQLVQILGIFSMLSFADVLFLLDEPESHLNPQWRVKFISRLMDLPTKDGVRGAVKRPRAAEQDCLLTTHAPFVPSDMARDRVFIFGKKDGQVEVLHPDMETFGTTFDNILEQCFNVKPPISNVSRQEIETLMRSENPEEIEKGMDRLGFSIEKVFLADRLGQLIKKG